MSATHAPERKWRAIAAATAVVTVAYALLLAGLGLAEHLSARRARHEPSIA
jgi:hypothetical protein